MSIVTIIGILFLLVALYLLVTGSLIGAAVAAVIGLIIIAVDRGGVNLR